VNICFIMYPWERVVPENDSTLRLIHESVIRKHTVGIIYPNNLTIRNSVTHGFIKVIVKKPIISNNIINFYKNVEFKEQLLPMSGFDVIFMRDNPPLDNTLLNFLDSVSSDTFIMNNIDGLRKANNKLYTAAFYDPQNEIIPVTHVSKNKEYLKKIIQTAPADRMILKPLNGFGGSGVIVIEKNAPQNINSLLDFYIDGREGNNYVILQEYVEGAELGDIRVLMLNGEPIGAMKRIPAKDDIRSNVHAGGTVQKHSLTKKEKYICGQVSKRLKADGLYFVGLDIINGKLIEINVCSPGGISRINKLNRVKLQKKILDFAEEEVRNREASILRKRAFRKTVEDA